MAASLASALDRWSAVPSFLPRLFARYAYVPCMLLGINGCAVICVGNGLRFWQMTLLLMLAICLARLAEHILPYEAEWNKSHGDAGKDVTHGFAYELSGLAGLLWLQLIALTVPWQGLWPREWPLGLQLLTAIIVTDLAVTLLHYASHHVSWLWKLHWCITVCTDFTASMAWCVTPCISNSILWSPSCRSFSWACHLPLPCSWAWPCRFS